MGNCDGHWYRSLLETLSFSQEQNDRNYYPFIFILLQWEFYSILYPNYDYNDLDFWKNFFKNSKHPFNLHFHPLGLNSGPSNNKTETQISVWQDCQFTLGPRSSIAKAFWSKRDMGAGGWAEFCHSSITCPHPPVCLVSAQGSILFQWSIRLMMHLPEACYWLWEKGS